MAWKVYNKMYVNGKPTGRKYVVSTGKTKKEAISNADKQNKRWNKQQKGNYSVNRVDVAQTGKNKPKRKKTISQHMSMFDWNF